MAIMFLMCASMAYTWALWGTSRTSLTPAGPRAATGPEVRKHPERKEISDKDEGPQSSEVPSLRGEDQPRPSASAATAAGRFAPKATRRTATSASPAWPAGPGDSDLGSGSPGGPWPASDSSSTICSSPRRTVRPLPPPPRPGPSSRPPPPPRLPPRRPLPSSRTPTGMERPSPSPSRDFPGARPRRSLSLVTVSRRRSAPLRWPKPMEGRFRMSPARDSPTNC